jgi:hypothetical protein
MPNPLPTPLHPDDKIGRLHDYWERIRTPGCLPSRKDFDPAAVSWLLPNIWLIDVVRPEIRFRYRLVGTAVVAAQAVDRTGRYLDEEVCDFAGSQTFADLQKVLQGKVSRRLGAADLTIHPSRIHTIDRIFLPLAADGRTVDMVLALSVYDAAYAYLAERLRHAPESGGMP